MLKPAAHLPAHVRAAVGSQADGWRPVDRGALNQLYAVFMTDTMGPACLRAVENRLLSSGILFTNEDYSVRASGEFQSHVNEHFTAFVRAAVTQIALCGWCFFVVEKDVPRVIPFGLADVRWRANQDEYRIDMGVFRPGAETPDENIYSIVDTPVDWAGNPVSVVANYVRTRSVYEAFVRNAMQADRLNACPPIYTTAQTDRVFDERDIMNTGDVEDLRVSTMDRARDLGSDMNARARLNANTHAFNEREVRRLNTRSADSLRAEKTDAATGLAHFDADMEELRQPVLPLPLDARVANAPRPVARTDIVGVMKHFEMLACVAFGVNSESVGAAQAGGSHMGANTLDRVNLVTAETTNRWARTISPTLVQVYKLVWGGEDNITAVFPSTLSSSVVERLYATHVLSHDAYVGYMSKTVQMPRSAFEKTDYRADEATGVSVKVGGGGGLGGPA